MEDAYDEAEDSKATEMYMSHLWWFSVVYTV